MDHLLTSPPEEKKKVQLEIIPPDISHLRDRSNMEFLPASDDHLDVPALLIPLRCGRVM